MGSKNSVKFAQNKNKFLYLIIRDSMSVASAATTDNILVRRSLV